MSDLARNIVQIAQARSPGAGLMESACNVTAWSAQRRSDMRDVELPNPPPASTTAALGALHARKVRDDLSTVLERAEAPEGEPC